jgi:formylglycine-generating enzyme required for sulfatase activity
MRSINIFLSLLVVSYCCLSQTNQSTQLPAPPHGVWLINNLFIDKTEITNIHWLEYLHYLRKDSSEHHYTQALPDTSVWLIFNDSAKYTHYLRYPGYRTYPVVGITHQQAKNYCAWRSSAVNILLMDPEQRRKLNIPEGYRFTFRLPSEMEWMLAASGNLGIEEFPYGFTDFHQKPTLKKDWKIYYQAIRDPKTVDADAFKRKFNEFRKNGSEPFFNCLKPFDLFLHYGTLTPLSTKTGKEDPKNGNPFSRPNALGLYDLIGNVAEMVLEPGIAKGGSWTHYFEESTINNSFTYTSPAAWLGFRCICEVIATD